MARPIIYPFSKMAVGDVVIVLGKPVRSVQRRVCDHKPMKFKTKAIVRGGIVAARVERVA